MVALAQAALGAVQQRRSSSWGVVDMWTGEPINEHDLPRFDHFTANLSRDHGGSIT